jgi:hypothetical protein
MIDLELLPSEVKEKNLKCTTEPMGRLLRGEPSGEAETLGEASGPSEWLGRVERAARKIAPYCPSPGGAIGAVIGRHHGGMKGVGVAAAFAHGLRSAAQEPDLEGFRYPGPFVDHCLQLKLRDRYWE